MCALPTHASPMFYKRNLAVVIVVPSALTTFLQILETRKLQSLYCSFLADPTQIPAIMVAFLNL